MWDLTSQNPHFGFSHVVAHLNFLFFFFFWFSWTSLSRLFHSYRDKRISGWEETRKYPWKTTWHTCKQSLTCTICDPCGARTHTSHRGEMIEWLKMIMKSAFLAKAWENKRFAKWKTQISFAVTLRLISAFVFATWVVQYLFFLNTKFQASSHLQ